MKAGEKGSSAQLCDGDFDFLWLGFLGFRQGDGEDAIFVGGAHFPGIDPSRKGDAPANFPLNRSVRSAFSPAPEDRSRSPAIVSIPS